MRRAIYIFLSLAMIFAIFAGCKKATSFEYSVDKDACISCGKCRDACPHDAIVITNDKASIIQSKCKQCGDCVTKCPEEAIR